MRVFCQMFGFKGIGCLLSGFRVQALYGFGGLDFRVVGYTACA